MVKLNRLFLILIFLTSCTCHPKQSPVPIQNQTNIFRAFQEDPTNLGVDILGLAMQDIRMIKKNLKPNTSLGVLEGTFGQVIPPLKDLISTGNVPMFRAHLFNYTCVRNKNCERGEPRYNDLREMGKRASAFEAVAVANPTVACYLSPWLESDITDKVLVNKAVQLIKQVAPHCTPVMSVFKGYIPPNILIERHGNNATANFISNDGQSFFDSNTDAYVQGADVAALSWWQRCNLRTSGEKSWTPPSQRTARIQESELQQSLYLLAHKKPTRPTFNTCPKAKELVAPSVWKTRSEDYNTKDPRENKSVLIIKGQYSKGFQVLTPSGKQVACLRYYGPYAGLAGYYRYYLGNCSGQNPMQLLRDAGQEWVCLKNGNTQFAVSSVRRSGSFR